MYKQSGNLTSLKIGTMAAGKALAVIAAPVYVNGKLQADLRAAVDSDTLIDACIHLGKKYSVEARKHA